MTIEEKAEELSGMSEHNYNTFAESNAAYDAALEAMEWILNKVYKWLEEHANEYNGSESAYDHLEEQLIADLRKAMEE